RGSIHRAEIRQPSRAAQLAATTSNSAQTSGFLAETNLLHFNTRIESAGKFLYQFPKIYAFFSSVIKNNFGSIALKFHIAYLHLKPKPDCDFTRTLLYIGLSIANALPNINIFLRSFAVNFWQSINIYGNFFLLHLHADQL